MGHRPPGSRPADLHLSLGGMFIALNGAALLWYEWVMAERPIIWLLILAAAMIGWPLSTLTEPKRRAAPVVERDRTAELEAWIDAYDSAELDGLDPADAVAKADRHARPVYVAPGAAGVPIPPGSPAERRSVRNEYGAILKVPEGMSPHTAALYAKLTQPPPLILPGPERILRDVRMTNVVVPPNYDEIMEQVQMGLMTRQRAEAELHRSARTSWPAQPPGTA